MYIYPSVHIALMSNKKKVSITLDNASLDWLERHPEINLSGLVRAVIHSRMTDQFNTGPEVVVSNQILPEIEAEGAVKVKCGKCGFSWDYTGKRSKVQCLECGHRINVIRNAV